MTASDDAREAEIRCHSDWHPAGDHAVLLRLLNRERTRIRELEAAIRAALDSGQPADEGMIDILQAALPVPEGEIP